MPVSDNYLVQYLLQETLRPQRAIIWREGTADVGFCASVGSLEVALGAIPSRGGPRIALYFRGAEDQFRIFEPLSEGWWSRGYATSDEHILADLLRELLRAVEAQCSERRHNFAQNPEEVRVRVFRQLLCGASAS
jgi:hypothetical protein